MANTLIRRASLFAAGLALAALPMSLARAQGTLPAYTVAEIQVTDPEGFKEYGQATAKAVPAAGGRFVVRNGNSFVINGEPPKTVVVIQWDSLEQARAFFESEQYKKLVPIRDKASKFRAFTIEAAK